MTLKDKGGLVKMFAMVAIWLYNCRSWNMREALTHLRMSITCQITRLIRVASLIKSFWRP
jgi:hypothetical protein